VEFKDRITIVAYIVLGALIFSAIFMIVGNIGKQEPFDIITFLQGTLATLVLIVLAIGTALMMVIWILTIAFLICICIVLPIRRSIRKKYNQREG